MIGGLLAALALFVWVDGAEAKGRNVQELLDLCKQRPDSYGYAICLNYIAGIGDVMGATAQVIDDFRPLGMCGEPTYGALVQAFVNWAEKHPEQWKTDPGVGVMVALRETFPCE
jgi:hypothetical protein